MPPPGFLQGLLIVLTKGGDPLDPGNYRPITLLNTDYRILAKVLAQRLGPHLNTLISREQSAFIPGRNIGEPIQFLQLVSELLRREGRSGVLAFLDFRKAYDTLDRDFLYSCLEAAGLGEGFLKWVKLMLNSTLSRAMVNGHRSRLYPFFAGVRQGDPLSPLLFLFAMQALQNWLLHCQVGTDIGGMLCTGVKYADDTILLLPSIAPKVLQHFLDTMDTFGCASGLRLHTGNGRLIPIGYPVPEDVVPSHVCGIPVVSSTVTLGLQFQNASPTLALVADEAWTSRMAKVTKCYTRLAKLPLSVFGRGFAASAYGIGKLLYHAEFAGLPEDCAETLSRLTKKLVDRAQAPDSRKRVLPGIPSSLLPGAPKTGGMGTLPWKQHVASRHAVWGARLLRGLAYGIRPTTPLWIVVASHIISLMHPPYMASQPPLLAFLNACRNQEQEFKGSTGGSSLPHGPLRRMAIGLMEITAVAGPLKDALHNTRCLPLGPWCLHAPLWGNPLLPGSMGVGSTLEDDHHPLMAIPTMGTVADAIRITDVLRRAMVITRTQGLMGDARRAFLREMVWYPELSRVQLSNLPSTMSTLVGDPHRVLASLTALHTCIPTAWLNPPSPPPSFSPPCLPSFASILLSRLGWILPPPPGRAPGLSKPTPVFLAKLQVKPGTLLQLPPIQAARQAAWRQYVSLALPPVSHPRWVASRIRVFPCLFPKLWDLKWENKQKEVFWRLAVDGVAGASSRTTFSCPCCLVPQSASEGDARLHAFWSCPIAEGVRETLALVLAPLGGPHLLTRANLWLCVPPLTSAPSSSIHPEVWMVVCLAALSAMDHGRRQLWRLTRSAQRQLPPTSQDSFRQRTLHEVWDIPAPAGGSAEAPSSQAQATVLAVLDFWSRLSDFALLHHDPEENWGEDAVPPDHPFLSHGGSRINYGAAAPAPQPPATSPCPSSSPSPDSSPAAPSSARAPPRVRQVTLMESLRRGGMGPLP